VSWFLRFRGLSIALSYPIIRESCGGLESIIWVESDCTTCEYKFEGCLNLGQDTYGYSWSLSVAFCRSWPNEF